MKLAEGYIWHRSDSKVFVVGKGHIWLNTEAPAECFAPAEPEPKFKVGDTVVVTDPEHCHYGRCGRVDSVNSERADVLLNGDSCPWLCAFDSLAPITPPPEVPVGYEWAWMWRSPKGGEPAILHGSEDKDECWTQVYTWASDAKADYPRYILRKLPEPHPDDAELLSLAEAFAYDNGIPEDIESAAKDFVAFHKQMLARK